LLYKGHKVLPWCTRCGTALSSHELALGYKEVEDTAMYAKFQLKDEELVLRLKCDVHRWMTAYIGVVSHPYFAVSGRDGTFEIGNVPVGTYTLRTWHERYGERSQPVRVQAGATTTVDVAYTGTEKAPFPDSD